MEYIPHRIYRLSEWIPRDQSSGLRKFQCGSLNFNLHSCTVQSTKEIQKQRPSKNKQRRRNDVIIQKSKNAILRMFDAVALSMEFCFRRKV